MIRVPYIQVQLVYRHFKLKPFHAVIDTGSDVTLISQNCYPTQHWKDLKKPIQILVASGQLTQLTKATFGQFIGIYDATTKDHNILHFLQWLFRRLLTPVITFCSESIF